MKKINSSVLVVWDHLDLSFYIWSVRPHVFLLHPTSHLSLSLHISCVSGYPTFASCVIFCASRSSVRLSLPFWARMVMFFLDSKSRGTIILFLDVISTQA